MSRWFRFYDDAINDPKILRLSDATFRAWVTLLCLASKHDGTLPAVADIALVLRIKVGKVAEWLATLVAAGLVDNEDGTFRPHNWNARQYKSDVSTERVKRFRQQHRNVSETVSETAPETEQKQIAETDQIREERARKRGARLAVDWQPSAVDLSEACSKLGGPAPASQELEKFRDYWKAQPGQRGVKLDWDATWRNWIRNAKGHSNGHSGSSVFPHPNAQQSGSTAVLAGVAAAAERRARERNAAGRNGAAPRDDDPAEGPDPELFGAR